MSTFYLSNINSCVRGVEVFDKYLVSVDNNILRLVPTLRISWNILKLDRGKSLF